MPKPTNVIEDDSSTDTSRFVTGRSSIERVVSQLRHLLWFLTPVILLYIEYRRMTGGQPIAPFLMLLASVTITAGVLGVRGGLWSGLLSCGFVIYSSFISFGPPALTGSFTSVAAGCIVILGTAIFLGRLRDQNRSFVGQLKKNATELARSRENLSEMVHIRTQELSDTNALLADSEQRLSNLLENAPDATITVGENGQILLANAQVERLFGYSRAELVGQHVNMLVPEELHGAHTGHVTNYFSNPTVRPMGVDMQLLARRKDGTKFPVEVSLSPIDSTTETVVSAAIRDVSARQAELQQLHQAQKMEAVGQLTGGVAHDFNNLLTIIIGNLQLLDEMTQDNEPGSELIQDALSAGFRGADLTDSLLAFSRRQLLSPSVTRIDTLVVNFLPLLERTLDEPVTLKTDLASDLWLTRIDSNQFGNVLVNLAINARDAMPDGGNLNVSACNMSICADNAGEHPEVPTGEYVVLSVSDDGCGIPKESLSQVFEPFFTTKQSGAGTGLGLSMVYGVVKQSKGFIRIVSDVGDGTCVKIYLPRSNLTEESRTDGIAKQPPVVGGSETILVVEDNDAVRKITVELLRQLGYQVLEANNGLNALEILQRHNDVDLLFTDIIMPGGLMGMDLARRAQERNAQLKVIFASGYADAVGEEFELVKTDDNLLNKPFQKVDLARIVRRILDQP